MLRWVLLSLMGLSASVSGDASLDQVSRLLEQPEELSGTFVQRKYIKLVDAEIRSAGKFSFQKNQRIEWNTIEPYANKLIVTPAEMLVEQEGMELSRKSLQSDPVAKVVGSIFFSLLSADWQTVERYFTLEYSVVDSAWSATLHPKQKALSRFIQRAELTGGRTLEQITLHESKGDYTIIQLTSDVP